MEEKRKFRVRKLSDGISYSDVIVFTILIIIVSIAIYYGDIILRNTIKPTEAQNGQLFRSVFVGCVRQYAEFINSDYLRDVNSNDVLTCVQNAGLVAFNQGVELNSNVEGLVIENCLHANYINPFNTENDLIGCMTNGIDWVYVNQAGTP